jgi:iron complex outermembrane recepter protein
LCILHFDICYDGRAIARGGAGGSGCDRRARDRSGGRVRNRDRSRAGLPRSAFGERDQDRHPLIETPQSISVVTRDQLEARNVNKLNEALRYTPGVQSEPFGIEPRFTNLRLRGLNAATTGFYRDGLVLSNPGFVVSHNPEPWGAERIEIPRGPASVLYGQGNAGGLVNYVSKRPIGEALRFAELEGGSHERKQAKFDFGGSIDDAREFSYRLTGLHRDAGTQIDFVEDDRTYLAPSFRWRPSGDTSLTLLGMFQEDDTKSSQALPAAGTLTPNPNGTVPISRFTGEPAVDRYDRSEYALGYLFEHVFSDALTFRQNARYHDLDLDNVVVFSNGIAGDLRTINRGVFAGFSNLKSTTIDSNFQLRLGHGRIQHTVLAGLDYLHNDIRAIESFGAAPTIDIFAPAYGAPVTIPAPYRDDDIEQTQLGVYLQDQVRLYEKWVVTLGGRQDRARTETKSNLSGSTTGQTDRAFTGRAGVLYSADTGLSPYASYSESFTPALGTDPSGKAFEPETGEQVEVGVKFQPPGGNSFVTAALFELRRQNYLQTDPVTFQQVQTGEIRSRGLELEAVASFDFGLDLIASFTQMDVEVTRSATTAEIGKRPTQIPERIAALWADYTFRGGSLHGLGVGAGVRYNGPTYGDALNTIEVPGFTLVDASLHYDWRDMRFGLHAQNLLDKEYAAACFVRSGDNFCTFGETRAVRATVSMNW